MLVEPEGVSPTEAEAAATVLGVGRAAYEYAFDYAKNRKQGGKFIIEHQAISLMLAKMIMLLDGARLQIWKAAWLADNSHPDARVQGLMANSWVKCLKLRLPSGTLS